MNPNIQKLVKELNSWGFLTTDSGDGQTHDFECDREYPYVVIKGDHHTIIADSMRLMFLLKEKHEIKFKSLNEQGETPYIQANYSPIDGHAFIEILNITDDMLKIS